MYHPHIAYMTVVTVQEERLREAARVRMRRRARRSKRNRPAETLPSPSVPWPPVRHGNEELLDGTMPPPVAEAG